MSQDIVPDFQPSHLWTETTVLLINENGTYGEIQAHYPTDMEGNPDYSGERQPRFVGRIRLMGTTSHGQQMQIPLEFPLPYADPIEAALNFKRHAQTKIEEFQSANLRASLLSPGALKQ